MAVMMTNANQIPMTVQQPIRLFMTASLLWSV